MSIDAVARARALIDLGRWSDAATALHPALADPHAGADPWCLLARCELGLSRYPQAQRAAERAAAIDPGNEWAHRLIGIMRLQQGDRTGALAACLRALELEPDLCEGLHLLSRLHLRAPRGRGLAEAERVAQHNVRVNPDEALSWEGAADVAAARRHWADVERYARRGLAINPHDAALAMSLGNALARQGRPAEAGNAYAAAARADPTDHRPRRAIGRLGLPLVGGSFFLVKLVAIIGARGISLRIDAPVWELALATAAGIGVVYAVVELFAWRARRQLLPGLQAVARRERRAAARGWLAVGAIVAVVLAVRAGGRAELDTAALLLILAYLMRRLRRRLPLPAGQVQRPSRLGRMRQSIRRLFR